MERRGVRSVARACALGVAVWGTACGGGEVRPHVVLVLADTLRADFLGCYGFDGDVSPNLDRLAGESVRFEACFSQAPWTKPAIASLFTSLHPQVHGVLTHDGMFAERGAEAPASLETDVLPDAAVTLAERLSDGGYETRAFVTNPWIRKEHGFDQGFEAFVERQPVQGSTAEAFDEAATWIESRTSRSPFFVYVHLMEVHGPYESPEADYLAVSSAAGLGAPRALTPRDQRRLPDYLRLPEWTRRPGAGDVRTWRGRYAAGVHAFDRHFGAFVERLRAAGRLDDTLLVVTSDHGEELLEHGGWDHGSSLHEHQLHVPLLLRLPRAEHAGRSVVTPIELVDLAPSILARTGLPVAPSFQGIDRGALWQGATTTPVGDAVGTGVKWKPELVSLRTATHRLVTGSPEEAPRLYDLRNDPPEQLDVAADEPELVRELLARLVERLEAIEATPALVGERAAVSNELRGRLEKLGYF